jgi:hypothetical protein
MSKYTEADMAFLQDLKDTSAFELARMAGCESPDSPTGPGAEFLGEIRDAVVERWEAGRFDWDSANSDGDLIGECEAEGIIPDGYHDMALLFVDLGAYRQSNEHTMNGEWTGQLDEIMRDAIAQIGYCAAVEFVAEARWDFGAYFECADCGDSGSPHVCFPGDCRGSDEAREAWAMHKEAERLSTATMTQQVPTDPILTLIAQAEAERAQEASVTQTFMANMARINADEFGTPWNRSRWLTTIGLGALALVGIIAVAMVVFG